MHCARCVLECWVSCVVNVHHLLVDCIHKEEGLWQGGEGAEVGTCTEDPPWAAGTGCQDVPREGWVQRAEPDG